MKSVVFVPGTMGSILTTPQGEVVWPPKASEVVLGYKRKDKLLQDNLVVGDIVREVSCFDVYKPIVETFAAMGFKEAGAGDRLHTFAYDWRRDLEHIADQLAARLDKVAAAGPTSIAIVAHSMGGLVGRLVLESGKFDTKPWFNKVTAFMTLGTPHLGAPLALARILGLDGDLGISPQDFSAIAADPRYPSGYQLLPAPGEFACWDIKSGGALGVLDIYDPVAGGKLGLDAALVNRARWVHTTLGNGKPPKHVRYFYFAGTGHKTATRVNVGTSAKQITRTEDAGDGTVPLWSALPSSGQKQLVVGEHTKFFTETNFKAVFFRLFGKSFATPPVGVAATTATLSVQALTLRKTDDIELMIIPGAPTTEVKGTIVIERTVAPEKPFAKFGKVVKVAYAGPRVPMFKMHLPPIAKPGVYRIRFEGQPAVAEPVMFAVTEQ